MVYNLVAKAIWEGAIPRNVWLCAAYIPGSQNKIADFKFRHLDEITEWSLSPVLFARLSQVFYIPWVDLFASRLNRQVDLFVSWKPEPEAWAVDAFSISWRDIKFYAFPPFSVPSRVLSKIKEDNASGILVVPLWPTQPWFPVMLDMMIDHPQHIEPDSRNLQIPGNPLLHPLHKRLTLLVTLLSGQRSLVEAYHTSLQNSSLMPGERAPKSTITLLYKDGGNIVVNGKLIPLLPL